MRKVKALAVGVLVLVQMFFSLVAFAEKTEIEFSTCWWLEPGRKEFWEEVVKKFEERNPDIAVKAVPIPYREYNDKMKVLFAGGKAPDVFYMLSQTVKLWNEMGWLEPLDAYFDFQNLLPQLSAPGGQMTAKIGDHFYGLLAEACPYGGLIFNKKILTEAGIPVPETPDSFAQAAEKLTKAPEMYGVIFPNLRESPSYIMQHAMIVIHGFGGRILKGGKFALTDPDFIEGVKYIKYLFDLGVMPKAMDYTTQRKMFWNGKAAMCLDGGYFMFWAAGSNPEVAAQLDVAPTPFWSKLNPLDLTFFGISSASSQEEKNAAAKFLEFYMSPEIQAAWLRMCGYPITMKSAVTPEYRDENPWFKVYETAAYFGVPLVLPGYEVQTDEIRKIIAEGIEKVFLGDSPEKAMGEAEEAIIQLVGEK